MTRGFFQRDFRRQPPALAPAYKTSVTRSPRLPLLSVPATATEETGPLFGPDDFGPRDADLLLNGRETGDPIGERIIVHGRVLDETGRPVPRALVEIWQANAAGRYRHVSDDYRAPVDRNFAGAGRCLTGEDGSYAFRTVKPGAYPWPNDRNAWRPAHIHFSLFGEGFAQRLVTQMYFEGDPLIPLCPILGAVPDADARERLVAPLDMNAAVPFDCLAYRFDVVLRGRRQTPFEDGHAN